MKDKLIITIERISEFQIKEKVRYEIQEDSDLPDWKDIFISILSFVSFDIEQIQELFKDGV